MLNPRVGSMVSMGSPQNFFTMVVFPALSNPRMRIRSSFSFSLTCASVRCCELSRTDGNGRRLEYVRSDQCIFQGDDEGRKINPLLPSMVLVDFIEIKNNYQTQNPRTFFKMESRPMLFFVSDGDESYLSQIRYED